VLSPSHFDSSYLSWCCTGRYSSASFVRTTPWSKKLGGISKRSRDFAVIASLLLSQNTTHTPIEPIHNMTKDEVDQVPAAQKSGQSPSPLLLGPPAVRHASFLLSLPRHPSLASSYYTDKLLNLHRMVFIPQIHRISFRRSFINDRSFLHSLAYFPLWIP